MFVKGTTAQLHVLGRIHFDDLQLEQSFASIKAYSQCKLAQVRAQVLGYARRLMSLTSALQVMSTLEFNRRLPPHIQAYVLHPGNVITQVV